MAPILAIVLSTAGTKFIFSILLLVMYGVRHCSVIVLAETFTEALQSYLNWSTESKGAKWLKKTCGVLVILGGIYLIFS